MAIWSTHSRAIHYALGQELKFLRICAAYEHSKKEVQKLHTSIGMKTTEGREQLEYLVTDTRGPFEFGQRRALLGGRQAAGVSIR